MWYDYKNKHDRLNFHKRYKKLINLKVKFLSRPLPYKNSYGMKTIEFRIPNNWECVAFDVNLVKVIYIFSDLYFFRFSINPYHTFTYFSPQSKIWIFNHIFKSSFHNLYSMWLNQIFDSLNRIFFKKIYFKGKGYYIFKNLRNTFIFRLNYAHKVMLFFPLINIKFLSKTTFFLFGINLVDINVTAFKIRSLRSINIFTSKGIRFTRQIVYKKAGKVAN